MYRPEARIIFTTENSRRISSWKHLAPQHEPLSSSPKVEERAIRETDEIAQEKIISATNDLEVTPHDHFISADTLTFAGTRAMKKPIDVTELQANFARIAEHNGTYDIHSHTIVGSLAQDSENALNFSRYPLGARIQLDPEKAQWLATPEGTQAYLDALSSLYDSHVSYTKIASGVCIMTLVAMGVVESLEGQKLDLQDEETALDLIYSTAYTAIINVSPQALFAVAESFHSYERARTSEEVLAHERELKKQQGIHKRAHKPETLQKYSESMQQLQDFIADQKAKLQKEPESIDSNWEKLRHHPYLEVIVAKVWQTFASRPLR